MGGAWCWSIFFLIFAWPSERLGCRAAPKPTGSSLLQPQALEDILELGVLAHVGQLDVDAGPQARPQIGRARQDVA